MVATVQSYRDAGAQLGSGYLKARSGSVFGNGNDFTSPALESSTLEDNSANPGLARKEYAQNVTVQSLEAGDASILKSTGIMAQGGTGVLEAAAALEQEKKSDDYRAILRIIEMDRINARIAEIREEISAIDQDIETLTRVKKALQNGEEVSPKDKEDVDRILKEHERAQNLPEGSLSRIDTVLFDEILDAREKQKAALKAEDQTLNTEDQKLEVEEIELEAQRDDLRQEQIVDSKIVASTETSLGTDQAKQQILAQTSIVQGVDLFEDISQNTEDLDYLSEDSTVSSLDYLNVVSVASTVSPSSIKAESMKDQFKMASAPSEQPQNISEGPAISPDPVTVGLNPVTV